MNKKSISNNMMESMVDEKLVNLMQLSKMCTCEQCCADVRALALDDLPPMYPESLVDKVMMKFELLTPQMQANITVAILHAIAKVSLNPRHSETVK